MDASDRLVEAGIVEKLRIQEILAKPKAEVKISVSFSS